MGDRPLNPGPPLVADPEYCASEPPSDLDFVRALLIGGLGSLVATAGYFAVVVISGQLWSVIPVIAGAGLGLLVNRAANGHRSLSLGLIAAGLTLLASLLGYGLLWLPMVADYIPRSIAWYHPVTLAIGIFLAYRSAGPKLFSKPPANR